MKTFSETERREIERRIQAACPGMEFKGAKPEFFLRPPTQFHQPPRVTIQQMDNTREKFPHLKTILVNAAGGVLEWGVIGCN